MKIKNQEGFFEQPNKGNSQSKQNSVKENRLFVCIGYGSEQLMKSGTLDKIVSWSLGVLGFEDRGWKELGGYNLCTTLVLRFDIRTRGYWLKSVRVESGNL
jgi:hypothetical protein